MLTFRSLAEVLAHKPRIPPGLFRCLTSVLQSLQDESGQDYALENDGFVVLITPDTTIADSFLLMGWPWLESPFEFVSYNKENGCFVACVLLNNQFDLSIIVPDEPWLSRIDCDFRACLVKLMECNNVN